MHKISRMKDQHLPSAKRLREIAKDRIAASGLLVTAREIGVCGTTLRNFVLGGNIQNGTLALFREKLPDLNGAPVRKKTVRRAK